MARPEYSNYAHHFGVAEELIRTANDLWAEGNSTSPEIETTIALAQVHATLALAVATDHSATE